VDTRLNAIGGSTELPLQGASQRQRRGRGTALSTDGRCSPHCTHSRCNTFFRFGLRDALFLRPLASRAAFPRLSAAHFCNGAKENLTDIPENARAYSQLGWEYTQLRDVSNICRRKIFTNTSVPTHNGFSMSR